MTVYQTKPRHVDAWQVPAKKSGQEDLVRTINYVGGEAYRHSKERIDDDHEIPAHISLRPHPFDMGFEQAFPGNWVVKQDVLGYFEVWSDEDFHRQFEAAGKQ